MSSEDSRVRSISVPCSAVLTPLLIVLLLAGCEPAGSYHADPSATADGAEPPAAARLAEDQPPIPLVYATPAEPPLPPVSEDTASNPGVASRVTVYVKLLIKRDFGMLAQLTGHRDHIKQSKPYHPDNDWWDNPLVVHQDAPPAATATTAPRPGRGLSIGVDAPPLHGSGESSHVAVALELVPHAHIALDHPDADALKGTLTLTLSSTAAYFDGGWTELLELDNHPLTFTFDTTSTPSATSGGAAGGGSATGLGGGRRLEPIGHETRTIPLWTFHRYTRGRQKWDAKSTWPTEPKAGDWFTTITGRDVKLEITAYRYAAPRPAPAE